MMTSKVNSETRILTRCRSETAENFIYVKNCRFNTSLTMTVVENGNNSHILFSHIEFHVIITMSEYHDIVIILRKYDKRFFLRFLRLIGVIVTLVLK